MTGGGTPGAVLVIAVCICTRDRPAGLARCLSSVLGQRLPTDGWQLRVVVVDNSHGGMERARGDALLAQGAPAIYIHEPRAGIPFARNAALEAAVKLDPAWVAFIDDDEVAPPGWLSQLLRIADQSGADVVHGSVISARPAETVDLAAAWHPAEAAPRCRRTNKAATNNVLLRTWLVADPVRLRFDEQMRETGGSDGEFFMRVGDAGARMVRTDDAPVFEERSDGRTTVSWQRKRAFRVGVNCNYRYRKNRQPGLLAALLILGRVAESSGRAVLRAFLSLLIVTVNRSRASSLAQKGVLDVCFAWGCVAPYFGVQPRTYY